MAAARYWSVERDGDAVVATCPEPLGRSSAARPEWMVSCAAAIRDELRLLAVQDGTLLEATLAGDLPPGTGLENVLLYNGGVPQAQVGAGVRVRRAPPGDGGFVQRYRRAPIGADGGEDGGERLASVLVPITDGHELETAHGVWRAVRAPGELARAAAAPGALDLRVRLVAGSARRPASVELVHKLLDGARAALLDDPAADLDEVVRRLDERICAAEVVFVPGGTAQLGVELRRPAG